MADTRKDKRAPVSLKVRFKSATVDEFIEHYCKDVSRGGIFIKSSQPMPVGTLLKFQFQLKDESQLIKGVGRVVWTRSEDRAGPERPAGMGIKFIKMDNESRVMVDRIINLQEGSPGAYEEGRGPDGGVDSDRPPKEPKQENFFPEGGPAELPPPEDRTAVRQAAEFLAAALSEVSDEAAAREAENSAEAARQRTAQIDAQRMAEAEQRKPAGEPLPSMIIDPALSNPPPVAKPSDRPTAVDAPKSALHEERPTVGASRKPSPLPPPPKAATSAARTSTRPSSPAAASVKTVSESLPALPTEKRSPFVPIIAIAAVLGVAGFMALRGGPEATDQTSAAAVEEQKPSAQPSEPQPQVQAAPEPTPTAPEPTVAPQPEPTPTTAAPAEVVKVRISTQPPGAEVSVAGVAKGAAPLVLDLEKGATVSLTASLASYGTITQEITPTSEKTLRFALKALPFVLHVESTPPGAMVVVAGKRGSTPVDFSFPQAPKPPIKATAKLPGYELGEGSLASDAFQQTADAVRATLSFALVPLTEPPVVEKPAPVVAPKPRPVAKPPAAATPKPVEPTGAEPKAPTEAKPEPTPEPETPKAEPKPEPKPEPAPAAEPPKAEPKPEPKPEKPEQLPDNPFG